MISCPLIEQLVNGKIKYCKRPIGHFTYLDVLPYINIVGSAIKTKLLKKVNNYLLLIFNQSIPHLCINEEALHNFTLGFYAHTYLGIKQNYYVVNQDFQSSTRKTDNPAKNLKNFEDCFMASNYAKFIIMHLNISQKEKIKMYQKISNMFIKVLRNYAYIYLHSKAINDNYPFAYLINFCKAYKYANSSIKCKIFLRCSVYILSLCFIKL